jgi:O-antigen/teichoic acid export membrane protein
MSNLSELDAIEQKFGKHVSVTLVVAVSTRIIALILVKILTLYLPKGEYAIYSLLLSLAAFLSAFSATGFSAALWRYIPRRLQKGDKKGVSRLFTTCVIGGLTVLLGATIVLYSLGLPGFDTSDIPDISLVIIIVCILAVTFNLKELVLVFSNSEQNSREVFFFNLSYAIGSSIMAAIFGVIFRNYLMLLIGLTVGYGFPVLMSLAAKIKQYGLSKPAFSDLKGISRYGGPVVLTNSMPNLLRFLAKYFIGIWIGVPQIAAFAIALSITGLFSFITAPPQRAYLAYITTAYEAEKLQAGDKHTAKIIELFLTVSIPMVWLLAYFSPFLIEIISTPEYLDAIYIIPFTLAAALMEAIALFWRLRINLLEKTHLVAILYSSALISFVVIALLFTPTMGWTGIGIAFLAEGAIILIANGLLGSYLLPFKMNYNFVARFLLCTISLIIVTFFLQFIGFSNYLAAIGGVALYGIAIYIADILRISHVRQIIRILRGGSI